jgi:hypothetical protein
MKVEVSGADRGLDFAGAYELESGRQIPVTMIGRLLDDGDVRRLQEAIMPTRGRPTLHRRPRRFPEG